MFRMKLVDEGRDPSKIFASPGRMHLDPRNQPFVEEREVPPLRMGPRAGNVPIGTSRINR
jgi:hypothetical protein